jgi:hypothetical protein
MAALDQKRISSILGSEIVQPKDMSNRERMLMGSIQPPPRINDDELDRCVPTDIPVRVLDEEESEAKTTRCLKGLQQLSVNSHVIKGNLKNDKNDAPLVIRGFGDTAEYAHEVILKDPTGHPVAKFCYRPNKPLKCGARVFFTTLDTGYTLVPIAQPAK